MGNRLNKDNDLTAVADIGFNIVQGIDPFKRPLRFKYISLGRLVRSNVRFLYEIN